MTSSLNIPFERISSFGIFDGKWYIEQYPDLQRAGLATEEQAWNHFRDYGLKEARKTRFMVPNTDQHFATQARSVLENKSKAAL